MIKDDIAVAQRIAEAVRDAGGRAYFVGGCVRDRIMGIPVTDLDVEVHGTTPETLESILDDIGGKLQFGKSFGVYSIRGTSIDIALPRKEECIGNKHTDFRVDVDPFLGVEKAAMRRDFTVNAIMQDVLTDEIVDVYGGVSDIENKIIRHVSDLSFGEDPLRVFRGAQFSARLGFEMAEDTKAICSKMELSHLSSERVFEELKKALLKAERPSLFFRLLCEIGGLSHWFPEVEALIGVEQSPRHHSEGDVFEHTMLVLDKAAELRHRAIQPLPFMISALVHDFGKTVATEVIDGEIHAYCHEIKGTPIINEFLHRLTNEKSLIRYVINMAELHMRPNMLAAQGSTVKATNRMFDLSAEPSDLILLALADARGSIAEYGFVSNEDFLNERLEVFKELMSRPHVTGDDLIKEGFKPDKYFSSLLEYAHKLRLAGVEKSIALKQVKAYYKENFKKEDKI